jgi:cytochrome c
MLFQPRDGPVSGAVREPRREEFTNMLKTFVTVASVAVIALSAGTARAAGDVKAGEKVFKKCAVCHDIRAGKHKIGPSLHGVAGRKAGAASGYKYSPATTKSGVTWTDENLDKYLEKPNNLIKGSRMAFTGLRSKKERDDVIAYIKTLK